ncbi:MAG: hypothetical protein JO323_00600 [Acidobacteriia bacterium]|nr:hypothetical protein [Terriglobia bacterium]
MTPAAGIVTFAVLLVTAGRLDAALEEIRAEPNLEKRSALAMDNAVSALKEARAAYTAGDLQKVAAKIMELEESVDLSYASLEKTGRDPRRSPRWFKRAEIESRDLLRSIETLEHDMSIEDRGILENTKKRVETVHDSLLRGLMEGKRK